jgi:toluene monooxygenase system protein A
VLKTLIENGARERAQYLVDKMWWRSWRAIIALTGTAMEYLTPLEARSRSFKEFMEEWLIDQFMKNLAEFDLERPWFWDQFIEELDFAHHSFQLGLYEYRTTLWFDVAMPDERERAWLNEKYPSWESTFGPFWDRLERRWETEGEAGTLAYALPALCNLCQLPALFVRPGRNTACTLEVDGRPYLFCSEPCRWIFTEELGRFSAHKTVVDRIATGEAPGKLTDLHEWMGLKAPTETGKDVRRGHDPWRLDPVPTA